MFIHLVIENTLCSSYIIVCFTIELASNCLYKKLSYFQVESDILKSHTYTHTCRHSKSTKITLVIFSFNQSKFGSFSNLLLKTTHKQLKCKLYWQHVRKADCVLLNNFPAANISTYHRKGKICIQKWSIYIFTSCTQRARVKILLTETLPEYFKHLCIHQFSLSSNMCLYDMVH